MAIVRGIELGRELAKTHAMISSQINTVEHKAQEMGISAHDFRDERGNYVLAPLLVAKAQVLHGLTLLNDRQKR